MKIGLVTWDYDPPCGGLGRAMQRLRDDLRSLGHEGSLFLPNPGSSRFKFCVKIHRELPPWIAKESIALLLFPVGPGGVFLLRKPKVPSIALCYHAYAQQATFVPGEWWKRIFVPFERRTFRTADHIAVYAPDTKQALCDAYRTPEHHITLLTQGFDADAWSTFAAQKEGGLCVCVARLDPRKGVKELLGVWRQVEERSSKAKLVIVGDGKERQIVDALIRGCARVRRITSLSLTELRALVSSAELALCPSTLEGFGLAAAEALAAGTPVIARDAPGVRSLVKDGTTGCIVPMCRFPERILELLNDAKLLAEFSTTARMDMHNRFDPMVSQRQLQDLLQTVCSGTV